MKCKVLTKTILDDQPGVEDVINNWLDENPGIIPKHIQVCPFTNASGNCYSTYIFIFYEMSTATQYLGK